MRTKKTVIIGIFIFAALIFAGCMAEKQNCCEPCKTSEITTIRQTTTHKETTTEKCTTETTTKCNTKPTTELTTKYTTKPITEPTTKCTTKPSTEPTTKCTTKPATEPTTNCTTKPTTEPATNCTTKPTTEPTTNCTTKPTTEATTKCTTQPTTEQTTKCTTTEKQITPQTVQDKINCYIRSKGIRVNHTLTPETAEWSVMISTKDEFLLTGITLKESIEVVQDYICALREDIACMYCYYDPDMESFYILYMLTE